MSDSPHKPAPGAPWERMGRAERIAAGLSLGWVAVAGTAMLLGGQAVVGPVLVLVVPVALAWSGVFAAHSSRAAREDSHRLRVEIEALQRALRTQSKNGGLPPDLDRRLTQIERSTRRTETALAELGVTPPEGAADDVAEPAPESEADMVPEMPEPAPQPQLSRTEMARALNFPDNDQDREGFEALRAALRDPQGRQLVQSSQDVLTLLSQDGIYMDDLSPEPAPAGAWRRLAAGGRGAEVAPLAGLDPEAQPARVAARLGSDTIFRDTVHHFLRLFDRMLEEYCDGAEDTEIDLLSETRSGRAFRLLGQAAGTFD
ncbi:hypothetical protein [Limimaricola pyoseonensis]|uniref:Uncharacterized protein n=1 Tax=Limimaricola pyoseonensis TaxID=521013 RepID=A0A1G7JZS4_9RHOB|nr:hypothetical protein [Limimaricola pyoseonensis]SDF30362.1 hypothetical protein SAMN04488567_0065 [Limimaricola pyoseonensis]